MPMPTIEPSSSFRKHPTLFAMFKAAENRHLTQAEMAEYLSALPAHERRIAAAREVIQHEQSTVEQVLMEVFASYPFESSHAYAQDKCMRDVRSVSAYATLSMLMNDPQWFRDKLLLWLRTILQAFHFPDREVILKKTMFGANGNNDSQNLAANQRSIFETYSRLRAIYKERLTPVSFALLEPYLDQAVNTLSSK